MHDKLRTVKQFCERNEAFTHTSVRWIIFRSSDDSDPAYSKFQPAIHRIGRKVFIDEHKFLAIAEGQAGQEGV
jgi:hypothetical protein